MILPPEIGKLYKATTWMHWHRQGLRIETNQVIMVVNLHRYNKDPIDSFYDIDFLHEGKVRSLECQTVYDWTAMFERLD